MNRSIWLVGRGGKAGETLRITERIEIPHGLETLAARIMFQAFPEIEVIALFSAPPDVPAIVEGIRTGKTLMHYGETLFTTRNIGPIEEER